MRESEISTEPRSVFKSYQTPLLQQVARNLLRSRNQWPREELIDRLTAALENAPLIDRRLRQLSPDARRLLAALARLGITSWSVAAAIDLACLWAGADGPKCVNDLLDSGLLLAQPRPGEKIESFEAWLATDGPPAKSFFVPLDVSRRALDEVFTIPDLCSDAPSPAAAVRSADGVEWLLRLAVLWQYAAESPFRLTVSGQLYKRDRKRLAADVFLASQPSPELVQLPDVIAFVVDVARALGVLEDRDGILEAGSIPQTWAEDNATARRDILAACLRLPSWNALSGSGEELTDPYSAAIAFSLLAAAIPDPLRWRNLSRLVDWIGDSYERSVRKAQRRQLEQTLRRFILGVLYPLGAIEIQGEGEQLAVRLTASGRWMLGLDERPGSSEAVRPLIIQPNLEMLVYRQGASAELIAALARFAEWTSVGPACSLRLTPESIYRGVQHGETYDTILKTLDRFSANPVPQSVIDTVRTCTQRSDRITVWRSAIVVEFSSPADLEEAIARGLPITRLTDRLAVADREADLPLGQFRLLGNRDYTLLAEPCVTVERDGVTLRVDKRRADILLEPEIRRFADLEEDDDEESIYVLTPESTARGVAAGVNPEALEDWFLRRCGVPLPPAARLLIDRGRLTAVGARALIVVEVADEVTADGLMQWPETARFIAGRIGPTTLEVDREDLPRLKAILATLGANITTTADVAEEERSGLTV